jgi:hypothetical protein
MDDDNALSQQTTGGMFTSHFNDSELIVPDMHGLLEELKSRSFYFGALAAVNR